jgi:beta-lactam-binding protein with PASTA domain
MTDAAHLYASFVKDCVVPNVKGKTLKAARRALRAHDCAAGTIKRAFSKRVKKGRVISQKPKPRKRLRHGAKVKLTISKGKRH